MTPTRWNGTQGSKTRVSVRNVQLKVSLPDEMAQHL
jgi:hypothetical protein